MDTEDDDNGAPDARGGSAAVIRDLNDAFRQTLIGGRCVVTAGVAALGEATVTQLLDTDRRYSAVNGSASTTSRLASVPRFVVPDEQSADSRPASTRLD